MQIDIKKKILESTLGLCLAYTDKKDASNISSHFLLSASMQGLEIKANDFEIGISYLLNRDFELHSEGKVCVNAKKLIERLKPLKNEKITLLLKDEKFYIKQGNKKYILPTFDYEDFPAMPSIEGKDKFDISSDELNRSLTKISSPIDVNHQRYALRGAFLDIKSDFINFVSTDTQRLAIYTLKRQGQSEFSLCIPKRAIQAMKELFFDDKKVDIFYDKETLIAKNDKYEFYTKLINDSFPDYERIIPKTINMEFTFPTDEFKDALKFIQPTGDSVKLGFHKDNISFESKNEQEPASMEIEQNLGLEEDFHIAFKIKFLMDFLNTIEDEEFHLCIAEPELAFLVYSGDLRTIIAPLLA